MHARSAYSPARPRGGEREVRRLLRGLQRPHLLHAEPVARMLCDVYGLETPHDAVIRLVHEALPTQRGSASMHLREIIERCDIAGNTQLGTAQDMNISMRQFFRFRSDAVKSILRHVNALVGGSPSENSPLEEVAGLLADIDPSAAATIYKFFPRTRELTSKRIETALSAGNSINDSLFENCALHERPLAFLAVARFLFENGFRNDANALQDWALACVRDSQVGNRTEIEFQSRFAKYVEASLYLDADSAEQCARRMRGAAAQDEWFNHAALLVEIEAAVRLGQIDRAAETFEIAKPAILSLKNLRLLGGLLYCQALIAFMRGDLEDAEAALRGAIQVLRHRPHDSLALEALSGRIKLQLGRPWSAPLQMMTPRPAPDIALSLGGKGQRIALSGQSMHCFPQLALEAAHMRAALLNDAQFDGALIDEFLGRSQSSGYPSVHAFGLAVAANDRERRRDHAGAQAFYCRAWAIYASTRDEFLGRDLFVFDATPARDLGPLVLDDAFMSVFDQILSDRFPDSVFADVKGRAEAGAFWRAAVRSAYLQGEFEMLEAQQGVLLDLLGNRCLSEPLRYRAAIVSEIPMRLSVFVPLPARAAFIDALSKSIEQFYGILARKM